ncbi:uncharacterized protein PGTG_08011 [Puccinia graminis f. sp. tritici CRL 75-36-700-3]|uniref:pectinesterase n=1 Tax=Puccinia graminis f. sp. tritici (strain CRL 75-36-700-3 / race SCCL) TaxID=418459 RepID=E3KB59_PUCGT|nr:uncharacterized protein PGTG_08011 [Puccinia graminis f. sp. tritici CRL 75-36-700-3]EFP81762.2 hypothetical protein PGTG_08011 [Puccinia graminis f. sp. tritici CRL 75-36-700-3]
MVSHKQVRQNLFIAAFFSLSAWAQSSPPTGALIVRQGSSTSRGEFSTISAAVASLARLTGPQTIFIYPGTYTEKVKITYPYSLSVQGYSANPTSTASNQVTVNAAVSAAQAGSNSNSATIWAHSSGIRISNLNIINSFGTGRDTQALALASTGNRQAASRIPLKSEGTAYFYGSHIEGAVGGCSALLTSLNYFDILGKQGNVLNQTKSYPSQCTNQFLPFSMHLLPLACYALDFIFGPGSAWFESVVLGVKSSPTPVITAQRNSPGGGTAFVFNHAQIVSAGAKPGSAYLGRPWSPDASVVYQFCSLSNVINPQGWKIWSPSQPNTDRVNFQEFQNVGPGASTSARQIGTQRSAQVNIASILGSDYSTWAQ